MYVGHFSTALAMKARWPATPAWVLLVGVGVCDYVFGVLVLLGVERLTPTPGTAPGFRLDFIDWSHSLAMSLGLGAAFGALLFKRYGTQTALLGAAAVASHFVLDFVMHPGDLRAWPLASAPLGLGLWQAWPIGWWVLEAVLVAACAGYYVVRARALKTFGPRAVAEAATLLCLHVFNSPWLFAKGL